MTDIEVGSLWVEINNKPFKVVCVTDTAIYTERLDDNKPSYWMTRSAFIHQCKPYTLPKEYKVWVYESKCGNVEVYRESQCEHFSARNGFMALKSILTGKEGDGL